MKLKNMKPSDVVIRLEGIDPLAIYANYIASEDEALREIFWNYVSSWSHVYPRTDGYLLQQLGIPPGPIYRQILQTLRGAWLDGTVSSPTEEESLLEQLLPKE